MKGANVAANPLDATPLDATPPDATCRHEVRNVPASPCCFFTRASKSIFGLPLATLNRPSPPIRARGAQSERDRTRRCCRDCPGLRSRIEARRGIASAIATRSRARRSRKGSTRDGSSTEGPLVDVARLSTPLSAVAGVSAGSADSAEATLASSPEAAIPDGMIIKGAPTERRGVAAAGLASTAGGASVFSSGFASALISGLGSNLASNLASVVGRAASSDALPTNDLRQ